MRRFRSLTLSGIIGLLLAGCGFLESDPPTIAFDRDFAVLPRSPDLGVTISDPAGGVARVQIRLSQGEDEVLLVEETFEEPVEDRALDYAIGPLIAERYDPQEGAATLVVTATDGGFRSGQSEVKRDFEFDLYPPRLELLSNLLYINQGGSENVVYRVSSDASLSGVQVGEHFFPGFPAPGAEDPDIHFALFAFRYDLPTETPVRLVARDDAGNQAIANVGHRVSPRAFRTREIRLDDDFLNKVVPEIMSRTQEIRDQGRLIDTYVEINDRLRALNHETIARLSEDSEPTFLWDGAFLQLSNSQVESLFADRRTYLYGDEAVDEQDHVGFDLSVVMRYPIEATNSGRVLLADYLGIYGNTVLLDHGAGLVSLYGHMSSIDVETGEMVAKGAILGRSGETGLAGGDHLHFGLFLHGVPVNPIEWWDPRWVQEHILDSLDLTSD